MKANLVNSVCVAKDVKLHDLADQMGLTTMTLRRKSDEPNKFTIGEVKEVCRILELSDEERDRIFFGN